MSRRQRTVLFCIAAPALLVVLGLGFAGLRAFGDGPATYRDSINLHTVEQRQITDAVTAVNFDYRGVDTIGEEFILFVSSAAVAVILRRSPQESEGRARDEAADRADHSTSDAVRATALLLCGPTVVLGVYTVSHGTISPGGGFQGGIVLATAAFVIYLAGRFRRMRRVAPVEVAELGDAAGAAGFVLVALGGLASGGALLANVLPLGTAGQLVSGGTVALVNASVGLEVAGGMVLIVSEFLEQALTLRGPGGSR